MKRDLLCFYSYVLLEIIRLFHECAYLVVVCCKGIVYLNIFSFYMNIQRIDFKYLNLHQVLELHFFFAVLNLIFAGILYYFSRYFY